MDSHNDVIERLKLAKDQVERMSWALQLHLSQSLGGGAYTVRSEAREISDRLDAAIEWIGESAAALGRANSLTSNG